MIGYVTLGTNDMARAAKFYDGLLAEVGGKRAMESDRFISWSAGPTSPGIGIIKPFDGKAASVGNGMMVAIHCDSPAKVKALYDKAMQLGAKDEGPPGTRWGSFYVAYFRDLDGNMLNAF
jgi:catechol 2,3-dioxygenase-like lactoylglutathione lyase family enzyme